MATRPSEYPEWADSGSALIAEPTLAKKQLGWLTGEKPPAGFENWRANNVYKWVQYFDQLANVSAFGDGSDSVAILDGTTAYSSFASLSGSTYTLTRDVFFTDLTINNGVTLAMNTFRVFGLGTLTTIGTGSLSCSGGAGGNSTGLSSPGAGGAFSGLGAGFGGTLSGGTNSATGGATGTGGGGTGGAGGSLTPSGPAIGNARVFDPRSLGWFFGYSAGLGSPANQPWTLVNGGGGGTGGAGGGSGLGAGGGGGGGGGVAAVCFRTLNLATAAAIQCAGGAGGSTAFGNSSGGGGGGGGVLFLAFLIDLNSLTYTAAINCPGGAAGASHGTGTASQAGAVGALELFNLGAGSAPAGSTVGPFSGIATFAIGGSGPGADYVDIAFPAAFAANPKPFLTVIMSNDTDGAPDVSVRLLTPTTMRIRPDAQFNGFVSWEVRQ